MFRSPRGRSRFIVRARKQAEISRSQSFCYPAQIRGMPPSYCRSVSRSLEPSLQSSLQLSLTVLVRYRSGGIVFSLGWSLPPFLRLHSQAILLISYALLSYPHAIPKFGSKTLRYQNGPFTLYGYKEPRSRRLVQAKERAHLVGRRAHYLTPHCLAFLSVEASASGISLFTRSYYGNPYWFFFLRLLICLSSAGNRVRFEE